jgi:tetratricopeptide (TPR) repeat protein
MLRNTCAACGVSGAKKDCGRCKTTYCSVACQEQHWKEGGHKDLCKRIKRGGGAEQYHADKKYKEAVAEAIEECAEATKGQTCYICRDEKSTEGLVRGCACHTTEGFAHLSCLVREAQVCGEDELQQHNRNKLWTKWAECGLCHQRYHGAVARALARGMWKTYVSRPEGDAIRGYALNIMGITKGMNNEEALCAATAYREWCCRFDPANIMTADENLALVYKHLRCHDEAISVLQRVRAEKLRRLRGSENEDSVMTLLNISASHSCAGRHAEAIALLSKERPAACRALGEDHHLCLSLARLLGTAHLQRGADLGDFLAAGAILRDVILRNRKFLGPDHPHTHGAERTFVQALEALEKAGCEADILEKLCSGVLRGGWHSKEYEPRSRPGPWT